MTDETGPEQLKISSVDHKHQEVPWRKVKKPRDLNAATPRELVFRVVLLKHFGGSPVKEIHKCAKSIDAWLNAEALAYKIEKRQRQPSQDKECLQRVHKKLCKALGDINQIGTSGRKALAQELAAQISSRKPIGPIRHLDQHVELSGIPDYIRALADLLESAQKEIRSDTKKLDQITHKNHAANTLSDACAWVYFRLSGNEPGRVNDGTDGSYEPAKPFEFFLAEAFDAVGITASVQNKAREAAHRFKA